MEEGRDVVAKASRLLPPALRRAALWRHHDARTDRKEESPWVPKLGAALPMNRTCLGRLSSGHSRTELIGTRLLNLPDAIHRIGKFGRRRPKTLSAVFARKLE